MAQTDVLAGHFSTWLCVCTWSMGQLRHVTTDSLRRILLIPKSAPHTILHITQGYARYVQWPGAIPVATYKQHSEM